MDSPLVTNKNIAAQIKESMLFILKSWPTSVTFFISGCLLLTIPDRYEARVEFYSKALSTSGIVTERVQEVKCQGASGFGGGCTSDCDLKVQFTNNGDATEFWDSCYKSANKNHVVPVLYDPDNISEAQIDRGDTPESLAKYELIWGMFIGLIGIGFLIEHLNSTNQN